MSAERTIYPKTIDLIEDLMRRNRDGHGDLSVRVSQANGRDVVVFREGIQLPAASTVDAQGTIRNLNMGQVELNLPELLNGLEGKKGKKP